MPANLETHQHELLYPNGQSALVFGTLDTGFLTLTPPQVVNEDGTVGDVARGREDGRDFGEDYLGSKNYAFEIGVLSNVGDSPSIHAANTNLTESMRTIWENPTFRSSAHTVGVLRSNRAGTTFRCYGRPRNFAEASAAFEAKGYTSATCEFALIDGAWYSDTEQVESLAIRPSTNPGLIGPLVDPLTTAPITYVNGVMVVGGTRFTWPRITIHGPVTNPVVKIGTMRVALRGSISAGKRVTIDPRPWARTVLRNDGANWAGALSGTTPIMRNMKVQPGSHQLVYEGVDLTGTSYMEVAWRDARSRP